MTSLHFYDQGREVGEGSVERLIAQLLEVIDQIDPRRPVGLIAHSWGAYLAYEALLRVKEGRVDPLVLVSPVGLTRSRFDQSAERLMGRCPPPVVDHVGHLLAEGRDGEAMRALFPYYLDPMNRSLEPPPLSYDNGVNEAVIADLGSYDVRAVRARLPARSIVIYGANDIEVPMGVEEISGAVEVEVLRDCGHFPFLEQPTEFLRAVARLL